MSHLNPRLPGLWTGGDYCPEQWPAGLWPDDARLMAKAHFQVATIGMFAWTRLEPEENVFDFGWLDETIANLDREERWFLLGTPSAAPPAWLSKNYPETLRTGPDSVRRRHRNRVNYNVGSARYREKCAAIARALAQRYGDHPRLLAWHLSNEYTGESDYSADSVEQFRTWLQKKFDNDLDRLNAAYWTSFWGHTYRNWDEIEPPCERYGEQSVHGLTLDWQRFATDQTIRLMLAEAAPLRELSPHVPLTTNLMGTHKGVDYRRLAPHIDFVSWDSYPGNDMSMEDPATWVRTAFRHDLMRSLKPDYPWLLIEYTPSSANWYDFMELKPPGTHRFETLQSIGHGSGGAMMFQWRQTRGGPEQLHGGVVGHGGDDDTRVFQEVREANIELESMRDVAGTLVHAEVGLFFDWETRWALDITQGPVIGDKRYDATVLDHYRSLWELGISVDLIGPDDNVDRYKLLIAPMSYGVKTAFGERVKDFVGKGGTFVTTYLSAWADENALIFEGGLLAPWRDLLGIRSEEIDALRPGRTNRVQVVAGDHLGLESSYSASDFCELVHPAGADVLAVFGDAFYAGRPALTRNSFGAGAAYYVASRNEPAFTRDLLRGVAREAGVLPVIDASLPAGVTVQRRGQGELSFVFFMNPGNQPAIIESREFGEIRLEARDVVMLRSTQQSVSAPKKDSLGAKA